MNTQRGFTVLELMVVLAVIATLTVGEVARRRWAADQALGQRFGAEIHAYQNAVQEAMTSNPELPLGVYEGTDWLKAAADCPGGLASVAYLPCRFPEATTVGKLKFQTEISKLPSGALLAQTRWPELVIAGKRRTDIAGVGVLAASGTLRSRSTQPMSGDTLFDLDITTGAIEMRSTTSPGQDIYIRRDGSNTMENPFRFNSEIDAGRRGINAVAWLQALSGEVLTIRSETLIQGDLTIEGSATATESVEAGKNIIAGEDVESGRDTLVGRNLQVQGNGSIAGSITVQGESDLNGAVRGGSTLDIAGETRLGSTLDVTGRITGHDGLIVNGTTQTDDLVVNNNATISGVTTTNELVVNASATFNGESTFNGLARFNDDVDVNGRLLVDSNRVFLKDRNKHLSSYLPNYVIKQGQVVQDEDIISGPSCPEGGSPRVFVIPGVVRMDVYVDGTWPLEGDAFLQARAEPVGGSWRIVLKTMRYDGTWSAAGEGLAISSCYMP